MLVLVTFVFPKGRAYFRVRSRETRDFGDSPSPYRSFTVSLRRLHALSLHASTA